MFTRRKGEQQPQTQRPLGGAAPSSDSGEHTVISADMTVSGDLNCRGTVTICGRVFGDVTARTLNIEEGAHVEGAVVAHLANIHGNIDGPVRAPTVMIGATARVVGTITHHTLAIEPGAVVEGRAPWRPRPDWEED